MLTISMANAASIVFQAIVGLLSIIASRHIRAAGKASASEDDLMPSSELEKVTISPCGKRQQPCMGAWVPVTYTPIYATLYGNKKKNNSTAVLIFVHIALSLMHSCCLCFLLMPGCVVHQRNLQQRCRCYGHESTLGHCLSSCDLS